MPYGDRIACAQYTSWKGLTSADEAVYVDWMRFYESLEDIPEETMTVPAANGIADVQRHATDGQRYYDLQGRAIQQPKHGLYILKQGSKSLKVVLK